MGKVIISATMSLDGFIADRHDNVGPLFDWYSAGDVEAHLGDEERVFRTDPASADYLHTTAAEIGAVVIGRHLFDLTNGWNGRPAAGDAVFVVTHQAPTDWPFPDAPFTFVTDGVVNAVQQAKDFAGDRAVSVAASHIGGQALAAGVVDEVRVSLAPVVLGQGIPFFGDFTDGPQLLENPRVIEGNRVTHLIYTVRHPEP